MGVLRRSSRLSEAIRVTGAVLLVAAWTLWTFFPEGGVLGLEETLTRGALGAGAEFAFVLVLSAPLRSLGVMRWSPLYEAYRRVRDSRRLRIQQSVLDRQRRREAPYRAIQSLGD